MARTPNQWNFASTRILDSLVSKMTAQGLADALDVSLQSIRNWSNGSIPDNRFQIAMVNLETPTTTKTINNASAKITSYFRATRISSDDFANLMGSTTKTVTNWINGVSRPRSVRKLNAILQDPRPLAFA